MLNLQFDDVALSLETGKWAPQTQASVVFRSGKAVLLVTVVASEEESTQDFFPLMVEYRERSAAGGRFPHGMARREFRSSDAETLSSRLIDRSIRPLFPTSYRRETVVTVMVFSADPDIDMPTASLNAVSLALMMSELPWEGPVCGLRIVRKDGDFHVFPNREVSEAAELDVVISVASTGIIMVEGGAQELSEDDLMACFDYAQDLASPQLEAMRVYAAKHGQPKLDLPAPAVLDGELLSLAEAAKPALFRALDCGDKRLRNRAVKALRDATLQGLESLAKEKSLVFESKLFYDFWDRAVYETARAMILEGQRFDGRRLDEVRKLDSQVALLPNAHGSAFFARGLTQALVSCTLGNVRDALRLDSLFASTDAYFFLHYNFPPYSVGEARNQRPPGRREIGHGMLAQRALMPVMPSQVDFPYTVRLVSDTLSSDGSSSMASVCGGCLALMDAGVPIAAPVAGIAMGLVHAGDKFSILTDIVGDEDHLGDMDFKICGTKRGVTAIQMDLKIDGLKRETLEAALAQARQARIHILDHLHRTLASSRPKLPAQVPKRVTIEVRKSVIGEIIGPGGSKIRALMEETDCQIDIDDDGLVRIAGLDEAKLVEAQKAILERNRRLKVGEALVATVIHVRSPFLRLELIPGTEASLHFSDLPREDGFVEDRYLVGDLLSVRVEGTDERGNIKLSLA